MALNNHDLKKDPPHEGISLVYANQVKKNAKLFGLTALSAFFIGASLMSSPAVARDKLNYKCDSACLEIAAPPPSTPTPHAGGGGGGGGGGGNAGGATAFPTYSHGGDWMWYYKDQDPSSGIMSTLTAGFYGGSVNGHGGAYLLPSIFQMHSVINGKVLNYYDGPSGTQQSQDQWYQKNLGIDRVNGSPPIDITTGYGGIFWAQPYGRELVQNPPALGSTSVFDMQDLWPLDAGNDTGDARMWYSGGPEYGHSAYNMGAYCAGVNRYPLFYWMQGKSDPRGKICYDLFEIIPKTEMDKALMPNVNIPSVGVINPYDVIGFYKPETPEHHWDVPLTHNLVNYSVKLNYWAAIAPDGLHPDQTILHDHRYSRVHSGVALVQNLANGTGYFMPTCGVYYAWGGNSYDEYPPDCRDASYPSYLQSLPSKQTPNAPFLLP